MSTKSRQAKSSILIATVLAMVLSWSSAHAGDKKEPVIEMAFADTDSGSLYVTGRNMDLGRLELRIAGFDPLLVVSNSDKHIEAMLPDGIPPGDYLLTFNKKGKPNKQKGIPYGLTIGPVGEQGDQGQQGVQGVQGIPGILALEGQVCPYKLMGFDAAGDIICAPPPGYWDVTHGKIHEFYDGAGTFRKVADIEACAAACDNESLSCKGFSFYEEGDFNGDNCKLLPTTPTVDGSGRFSTPTKTFFHYASSAAWNSTFCGPLVNDTVAVRLAAAETLANNIPSVVETARRLAPDYIEGEQLDLAWLYATQCRTIESWELAVSLASTPLRLERAVFEKARIGGDNESYLEYVVAYPDGHFADDIDDLRWEYAKAINLPRHYYDEYNGKCPGTPCKYRDLAKKFGDEFVYTVQAKVASIKVISAPGVSYSPDCLIASLDAGIDDAGTDECGSLEIFHNLAFGLKKEIDQQQNDGTPPEFKRLNETFYSPIDIGGGERYLALDEGEMTTPFGYIATSTARGTSYQDLQFGGFMFEVNLTPDVCRYGTYIDDLGHVTLEDGCTPRDETNFLAKHYFYNDLQQLTGWSDLDGGKNNGIWSKHWKGYNRDLVAEQNLMNSYKWDTIKPINIPLNRIMDDGEWEFPPVIKKMIVNFGAGEQIEITWEFIRSSDTHYERYLNARGFKCDAPIEQPWQSQPTEEYGPGFHIVNRTDYPLDISLEQVGPLYYELVDPGQPMARNTGAVWFTIKAAVNLDGTPKNNLWTAAQPIAEITGQVLFAAITGGSSAVAAAGVKATSTAGAKIAIRAAVKKGTAKAVEELANTGISYKSNAASVLINGDLSDLKGFATALVADAFKPDHMYVSDAGEFAGPAWPFRDTPESYVIEGGPKAPCVDSGGNVVFLPSEPMTIREYYP